MRLPRSIAGRIVLAAGLCCLVGGAAVTALAFAPSVREGVGTWAGTAAFLAGAVALCVVLSHRLVGDPLSRRIARLADLAKHTGRAETTFEVDDARDEVGDLSRALNAAHKRMLDHQRLLSAQYHALRNKQVNLAHDLRTPLTTLLLALEQARDAAMTGEDPGDPIRAAMSEGLYMTSLVENLRIASRMDAGFERLGARSALDLVQLVQRIATRFRLLAKGSGTEVDVAHPDSAVLVEGDDTMVEQAVTNLVQNSLSYGGADQQIIIRLDVIEDRFRLDVLDEGPGIPEAALDAITQRWVRARPRTKRAPSGQGLGLAIVSEVAAVHGWELSLDNREEGGLRARIEGAMVS